MPKTNKPEDAGASRDPAGEDFGAEHQAPTDVGAIWSALSTDPDSAASLKHLGEAAASLNASIGQASLRPYGDAVRSTLESLQQIQMEAYRPQPLAPLRIDPKLVANQLLEEQTERLVDLSVRTSTQIGQLATLAEVALEQQAQGIATAAETREESRRLRETMADFSAHAKRSSDTLGRLTWVLVILTLVLVAAAVWTFAGGA